MPRRPAQDKTDALAKLAKTGTPTDTAADAAAVRQEAIATLKHLKSLPRTSDLFQTTADSWIHGTGSKALSLEFTAAFLSHLLARLPLETAKDRETVLKASEQLRKVHDTIAKIEQQKKSGVVQEMVRTYTEGFMYGLVPILKAFIQQHIPTHVNREMILAELITEVADLGQEWLDKILRDAGSKEVAPSTARPPADLSD